MDIHTGIFFLLLWFGVLLLSVFLQVAALQTNVSLRCSPLLFLCQWITSQHCNSLLLKTKNSEHVDRFLAILEHYLATGGKDEPQGRWWRVDALFPNCLQFGWHATSLVLSKLLSSFSFFRSQGWFLSPSLSTHRSTVFCFCAVCLWDDRKRWNSTWELSSVPATLWETFSLEMTLHLLTKPPPPTTAGTLSSIYIGASLVLPSSLSLFHPLAALLLLFLLSSPKSLRAAFP